MIDFIVSGIQETAQNAKVAAAVSAGTATTGTMTWLEVIPSDIGKAATLVGIILSSVLIVTHWTKHKNGKKEHDLRMEVLQAELDGHNKRNGNENHNT